MTQILRNTEVRIAARDYDFLAPLAMGDVEADGIPFAISLGVGLNEAMDQMYDVAELSLARHLRRLSDGDRSWVGIPLFVRRAFCHRTWYVSTTSEARDFKDLTGSTIGTNEWPATGNTWARAAGRDAGLDLTSCKWIVGSVEGGPAGSDTRLPPYVSQLDDGLRLIDLLVAGEIDAIVNQLPPSAMYQDEAPVRRLVEDFVSAEREFFERTKIYPLHHIMGVRKSTFEENPWILTWLFRIFEESRMKWQSKRFMYCDTSPWLLSDMEWATRHMGKGWPANGSIATSHEVEYLCEELLAQGLITAPIEPTKVFAEFEAAAEADIKMAFVP